MLFPFDFKRTLLNQKFNGMIIFIPTFHLGQVNTTLAAHYHFSCFRRQRFELFDYEMARSF